MNFLIKDNEEADCILVEAYAILLDEPEPTPELLGGGYLPRTMLKHTVLRGWHPVMGVERNCGGKRAFARGPLLMYHIREHGKTIKTDAFCFRETISATKRTVTTHHNAHFYPPRGVTRTFKRTHLPAALQV